MHESFRPRDKIFELFKSSTEFEDRHHTVGLPCNTNTLILPDNFTPSKQRVKPLVKRPKHQPKFFKNM